MNESSEQENQKERVVRLNEEFLFFDPNTTRKEFNQGSKVNQFFGSIITLDTEGLLPQFKVDFNAFPSRTDKVNAITPFDPDEGYRISNEDLNLETRIKKLQEMKAELSQQVDFAKAPLHLEVQNSAVSRDFGKGYLDRFDSETLRQLSQLRVQVRFPNGLEFEASPDLTSLILGQLKFKKFYPVDTGPLPAPKDDIEQLMTKMQEGFGLYVPSDKDKLTQIKAKILLTQEEKADEDVEVTKTPDKPSSRKNNHNGVPDVFNDAFKEDKDW